MKYHPFLTNGMPTQKVCENFKLMRGIVAEKTASRIRLRQNTNTQGQTSVPSSSSVYFALAQTLNPFSTVDRFIGQEI
jgi:hypothetical protein